MAGLIVLVRHGETEWSRTGRHTGRSDLPLTEKGRSDAARLTPFLAGRAFGLVLVSPLGRAQETARLAGLSGETEPDLVEWDYGAWEGRRTADIRTELGDPEWTIWRDPIPPGETPGEQPAAVAVRAQRVIDRCLPVVAGGGDVALVAHGHFLRMLTATWLGLSPQTGRRFALDAGRLSALGFEHEWQVVQLWNARQL